MIISPISAHFNVMLMLNDIQCFIDVLLKFKMVPF